MSQTARSFFVYEASRLRHPRAPNHCGFMRGEEPPLQLAQPPFFLRLARSTNMVAVMITTAAAAQVCQSGFIFLEAHELPSLIDYEARDPCGGGHVGDLE